MEQSRPRPKLRLALLILKAEERAAEADARAAEAHRHLDALYTQWDADVEDGGPVEHEHDDTEVEEDIKDVEFDLPNTGEGPSVWSGEHLPWQDERASKAERVRRFFRAHPDAQVTASDLEDATGVPAKNINQILSRGLKTPENPDGFVDRPKLGVYMLTERARAWARAQHVASVAADKRGTRLARD